jgi:uncharacterized protein RhaS with RHS repeats
MGLYTQQDPIGLSSGVNLYGYAGGDPVNMSDPYGLDEGCTWAWTWEHGMCPIELEPITVTVDRTPECFTSVCGPEERARPWAQHSGPGESAARGGGAAARAVSAGLQSLARWRTSKNASPLTTPALVAARRGYEVPWWMNLFHGGSNTVKMLLPLGISSQELIFSDGELMTSCGQATSLRTLSQ